MPRAWRFVPLCLLFVALALGAIVLLASRRHIDIDIHSGRERSGTDYILLPIRWTVSETRLSQTLAASGYAFAAPEWRRVHTAGGPTRIQYRYGGFSANAHSLMECLDTFGAPESSRISLAKAALGCLESGQGFDIDLDEQAGTLRLRSPGDHAEIASAPIR
jgi:hypothetical protein